MRSRSMRPARPRFYSIVNELAHPAHIPMPRLYLIDSDTPNAFATGRNPNHAAVAVTRGIMRICSIATSSRALSAHELSHVINRDILTSSIAATLAGAVMMLGTWRDGARFSGVRRPRRRRRARRNYRTAGGSILAPIAASMIQLAISRTREYQADASGAQLYAQSAAAGERAAQTRESPTNGCRSIAGPATAHLFIVNPLSAAGCHAAVLDPSANRGTDPAARAHGGGKLRLSGSGWRRCATKKKKTKASRSQDRRRFSPEGEAKPEVEEQSASDRKPT